MTSTVVYKGDLRTEATHLQSGATIFTDAPIDNEGKGEAFSPTDLVATALASCMATIMGIAARTHEIALEGTRFEVTKVMAADPRRIAEIGVDIYFPETLSLDAKQRMILEKAAMGCPVLHSLHPDCRKTITFH
ncbi:MAG: OsmC family peroxiredoxin [Sphingobacteriales bacterium]|nr:MAG: OsmC family peroxiredoxin [Sphingobacteriales bacterium]